MELTVNQHAVLDRLQATGRPMTIRELADALGIDQSPITAACGELKSAGCVEIQETAFNELKLGPEGEAFAAKPLPERVIVDVLRKQGGACKLTEIPSHCSLNAGQVGGALKWLQQRGWAKKEGENLTLANPSDEPQPDERLIEALKGGKAMPQTELAWQGLPVDDAIKLLQPRKGFLVVKERTERRISLTDAGRQILERGVNARRKVTQLTPDLLAEGGWREVDLQPYDVTLAAKKIYPGKEHPFQRLLERVRRVFLELGFEEVVSPWVESSFWDFDALFQPQDHPARDMQDTFYVAKPARSRLPDDALVEHVKATHENGGNTGSTGWQYRWERDRAHKPVLRTHTTAATIRALARHRDTTGGGAGRYFVIGPVFRRETVDYKHLPVFHQVDGIIVDPNASLATLVGTLTAFYTKMGFPKVRVVPSFFPYTEPSAEVHLWLESRQSWVEMGGSGIFRPEVTRPVGIDDRVLAWGLGLERLAMFVYDVKSIGELFYAAMPWLRETPTRA